MFIKIGRSQELSRPISSWKAQNIRCLSLVVLVVFALSFIEFLGFMKIVDYPLFLGNKHANIEEPELLHIHIPHKHYSGALWGGEAAAAYQIPASDMTLFRWDVRYDHNGFRNEVDLTKADMIVIGDSFVEAPTISNAELTTSILSRLRGEVVANLGQSGYGPQQELIVLRRYGFPLRARTAVWMFFEGNDLRDVITYRQAMEHRSGVWHAFVVRSFTGNALKAIKRLFPSAKPPGVKRSGAIRGPNGNGTTMYFVYRSGPFSKEDLSAFDETTLTLAAAHKLCVAQGCRLIVVFIPTKFRVLHEFCQFPQESECRDWVLDDLPDRLKRAVGLISPEIRYLDLTPDLVESVKSGVRPYYPDDDHWSPEGHRIAAEAINNYLLATQSR